jgi:ribosomal protein S18 acetylase RimI-like enzyme
MSGQLIPAEEIDISLGPHTSYLVDDYGPQQQVWLLVVDAEVVGGVRLHLRSGDTGLETIGPNVIVADVSVEPPHRRQGHAREMLRELEVWIRNQHHLPHTASLAVETDNEPAIRLYESLGYRYLGAENPVRIASSTPSKECYVMFKPLA